MVRVNERRGWSEWEWCSIPLSASKWKSDQKNMTWIFPPSSLTTLLCGQCWICYLFSCTLLCSIYLYVLTIFTYVIFLLNYFYDIFLFNYFNMVPIFKGKLLFYSAKYFRRFPFRIHVGIPTYICTYMNIFYRTLKTSFLS
jgi:hypothetical protein